MAAIRELRRLESEGKGPDGNLENADPLYEQRCLYALDFVERLALPLGALQQDTSVIEAEFEALTEGLGATVTS